MQAVRHRCIIGEGHRQETMKALILLALLTLPAAQLQEDPVEAWAQSAVQFLAELERLHPDPFFGCSQSEFESGLDLFLEEIEGKSEEESLVEFMRFVAKLSREGRDGHSSAWPARARYLPLRIYGFADGWFVVDADASQLEWVGARLLAIGGVPIDKACQRLVPLLTGDNDWNRRLKLGRALTCAEILAGSGLADDPEVLVVTLERDGKQTELTLSSAPAPGGRRHALPDRPGTTWLEGRQEAYRLQVLEAERTLYVQFNQVTDVAPNGQRIEDFATELVRTFEENELEKVVVDVRSNGGGNNTTFTPLIAALQTPSINKSGVLFCLIGRETFSAAGNFVTTIEHDTRAILVGEPTGGAPNQYGDARNVPLPGGRNVTLRLSTRYHQFSSADDARLTHEPQLAIPLRSADFFAGRDPVLAAALTYSPPR
jgi:hypothetical protein